MSTNYPLPYTEKKHYQDAIRAAQDEMQKIQKRVGIKNSVKNELCDPIKERIATLNAALRQCEPDPISPTVALQALLSEAQREQRYIQENIDKALAEINNDPLYGIAWSGEKLIKYSHKLRIIKLVAYTFSDAIENSTPFTEVVKQFNALVEETKRSLLGMRLASSTSVFHNMVDNLKYEAQAEALDWSGGYAHFQSMINRMYLDAVEVYNRVNGVQ